MSYLVQFAGDDKPARQKPSVQPSVYSLFLRNMDTIQIAERLKMEEHEVERVLTVERSRAKGVTTEFAPSPYKEARAKNWRDGVNPAVARPA